MTAATLLLTAILAAGDPAADLQITLELVGAPISARGEYRSVKATMFNTSKTDSHWVVRTGDGSEMSWREPSVWLTAEADTGTGFQPVDRGEMGRCGMYDHDWPKDVVELKPGGKMELSWLPSVTWSLDLPNNGKVKVRLHYAWQRPGVRRSGIKPESVDSPIKNVAPYEIISAPLELTMKSPVAVSLKKLGDNRADKNLSLKRLLDVSITQGQRLVTDVGFQLRGGKHIGHRPYVKWDKKTGTISGAWDYPEAEKLEIRALVSFTEGAVSGQVTSDWIPFPTNQEKRSKTAESQRRETNTFEVLCICRPLSQLSTLRT